jgi:hypothetical protein
MSCRSQMFIIKHCRWDFNGFYVGAKDAERLGSLSEKSWRIRSRSLDPIHILPFFSYFLSYRCSPSY